MKCQRQRRPQAQRRQRTFKMIWPTKTYRSRRKKMAQIFNICGSISAPGKVTQWTLFLFVGERFSGEYSLKEKPFVSADESVRVTLPGTRRAPCRYGGFFLMYKVRRHLIYYYLLTECLALSDSHRQDLEKHFGETPDLCVSAPSIERKIIVIPALAQ